MDATNSMPDKNLSAASELAVLVLSCDRYADLWPPFFALFKKYWPDCPYPVYLGANTRAYADGKVTSLGTGADENWSDSARAIVSQIPEPYVLILLEDFLLTQPVDSGLMAQCLGWMKELDAGYMRLKPYPPPDRRIAGIPLVGEIETGAPYRVSLMAAIWEKDTFLQALKSGESAWQMELLGSARSGQLKKRFFCTWRPVIHYLGGVTFGKWLPAAVKFCRKEGIALDLAARGQMSTAQILTRNLRKLTGGVAAAIPWKTRRKIKKILQGLVH